MVDRRERLAGPLIGRGPQVSLESSSLFDMEAPEVAPFDGLLEAFDRARRGVDGSVVASLRVLEVDQVRS